MKRAEIDAKYKWDIASMYPDETEFERDCDRALALADSFISYSGHLADGGGTLLAALRAESEIWQIAGRVFTYAKQRLDEDTTASRYQAMQDRAQALFAQISARTAFFVPEVTALTEAQIAAFYAKGPDLTEYAFMLRQILRKKPHVLSQKEEELFARLSEVLGAPGDIFSMLSDADMRFGEIMGEDGKAVPLTHGSYGRFLESKNRAVRRAAYEALYTVYKAHENTLAAAYSANVKTNVIGAELRQYPTTLAAALSGDHVDEAVYENLIETVSKNLPALHHYLDAKRRALGLDTLAMYDLYAPAAIAPVEREIPFEEAVSMMKDALAPLGAAYVEAAVQGALADGWIDVFENENKASGAYSFGCYGGKPFILMNYQGRLRDVFTLVHEMGHSMHSYYRWRAQPFQYGDCSIFTAEVASTVNESLLMQHLLTFANTDAERAYYLNFYLEEFRATVFRQTMFAEFEKLTHEAAERGEALTNDFLCELYGGLNAKYQGADALQDVFIRSEWSRIPHFYRAFYVYKYATGFSAATAIAARIRSGGEAAVADYLRFLSAGSSDDPIELLKIAGVDMARPEPVEDAMNTFSALVDEFDRLISSAAIDGTA